jgi:hypothetical protein
MKTYAQRFHGGLSKNLKTHSCVDFTTICPRKRAGNPCKYCYVESHRKARFHWKPEIDHTPYDGWVNGVTDAWVGKINDLGGVRMFSFGDYMVEHDKDISSFLDDAAKRGVMVKTITKQVDFIKRYVNHPALSTVHIGVDSLGYKNGGSQVTHATAKRLREKHEKVLIRAVCLSMADLEKWGNTAWADILTLSHGANGFHPFLRKEHTEAGKRYPGRICCVTGKCKTCLVKCGVGKVKGK